MELRGCEAERECGRAKGGDVNETVLGDVAALEGVVGFDGARARVRLGVRPHAEGLVTDDCGWTEVSTVSRRRRYSTRSQNDKVYAHAPRYHLSHVTMIRRHSSAY